MRTTTLIAMVALAAAAIDTSKIPAIEIAPKVWMPMAGLGTWQYNVSTAQEVVTLGLNQGFKHIDAAWAYKNQRGVAKALKGVDRSSYFLTTKVPDCGRLGGCC